MSKSFDLGKHIDFPPGAYRSVGPWPEGLKISCQHPGFSVVVTGPASVALRPDEARRFASLLVEEAAKAEASKDKPCAECSDADAEERYGWNCFGCHFWLQHIRCKDGKGLVIGGHHYRLGGRGESVPSFCRGHGGRKAVITYLSDGREVESVDLWYQGEIPKRFKGQLPDTAKMRWV